MWCQDHKCHCYNNLSKSRTHFRQCAGKFGFFKELFDLWTKSVGDQIVGFWKKYHKKSSDCSFQLINDKIACCSLLRRFLLQESCSPNKTKLKDTQISSNDQRKKRKECNFSCNCYWVEKQLLLTLTQEYPHIFLALLWKERNKKRRKRREYGQWRTIFLLKKNKVTFGTTKKNRFLPALNFGQRVWRIWLLIHVSDCVGSLEPQPKKPQNSVCWRVWNIGVNLIKIS